nr:Imm43 family immunity protein [Photorhabdus luminescens]
MDHILSDRFFYIINEFKLSVSVLKKLISTSIKYRSLIPHKLSFHNESLNYDIFSIRTTLLAGFIFISEKVANKFSKENIKGINPIKLDEVLNHYCVDFRYDIKANVKKGKIKLP